MLVLLAMYSVALADSKTETTAPGAAKTESAPEKPPNAKPDAKARAARLEEMHALAAKLSFEEPGRYPRTLRHIVVEEPLLHYTAPDKGLFDGTLWAYGRQGRPVAFVEMYCGPGTNSRYRHATTGTCDRPLKLIGAPRIQWTPQSSAIAWTMLKADTNRRRPNPAPRLRQTQIARQTVRAAYQIFEPTKQREELRLLVAPLIRYSDANDKIRDGAVFALALGTNPEALLFIEARDDGKGDAVWYYGWARARNVGVGPRFSRRG